MDLVKVLSTNVSFQLVSKPQWLLVKTINAQMQHNFIFAEILKIIYIPPKGAFVNHVSTVIFKLQLSVYVIKK